jgi:hypothetical protein
MAVLLPVIAGCERVATGEVAAQSADTVESIDLDILPLSVVSMSLPGVVGITEEAYRELIVNERFSSSDPISVALPLGSKANDKNALGLTGQWEGNVNLDGKTIVVLHNPRKAVGALQQATSFSVVGGELHGYVQSALVGLSLHFSQQPAVDCTRPFRGCSLAPEQHRFANWDQGGLGFPPSVRLDAESPGWPVTQYGRSTELWILPNPDVAAVLGADFANGFVPVGARYVCAEPFAEIAVAECDNAEGHYVDSVLPTTGPQVALSSRVALISETDFQSAVATGKFENKAWEPPSSDVAIIASSLNDPQTLGVHAGSSATRDGLEVDVLIVAKSPRPMENGIDARRVFVVPGPLRRRTVPFGLRQEGVVLQESSLG